MVLLAAAIISKYGKTLVARQFLSEVTRHRLEALLDVFPKLIGFEKAKTDYVRQHTFIESEYVRYVYQSLGDVFIVLVTTKTSNILEDLEALRLFARVIPEYCRNFTSAEILDKAFEIIFAFDEIVALGYREPVNLAMITTFTSMISHDERNYLRAREVQMQRAAQVAKEKAKEIRKSNSMERHLGLYGHRGISGGSISSQAPIHNPISIRQYDEPVRRTIEGGGKALKLGGGLKRINEDEFLHQVQAEGEFNDGH